VAVRAIPDVVAMPPSSPAPTIARDVRVFRPVPAEVVRGWIVVT
jgi:hypothetical protein